jgi:superfamily II RNA helicase
MPSKRDHQRRAGKRFLSRRRDQHKKSHDDPRLDPQLKQIFSRIGVPEARPFEPDPFQLEALKKLQQHDVIVSAPTGAGKTWIASQAIQDCLSKGLRAWYASPLKALSNSIYQEFNRIFGSKYCGILTGDRKENPDAPIVVGTTEILRNQLYDAMQAGADIQTDLVVLDEAHYLSDPDRGVVWEETLIYLPARVRLLLLSATISNAHEVSDWLTQNRGNAVQVVWADVRPVPLEMLFLFPDGLISPLSGKNGLVPRVKKYIYSHSAQAGQDAKRLHYSDIIRQLRDFDLLPAIFFLKSRLDCDKALLDCLPARDSEATRERLRSEVHLFLQRYPHLKGHRQMRALLDGLVAAHHAGQLPYWKVLIETMMNKGYLEAIFSTSTVAAGVNFPARTVVLVQSDRFNGHQFADLTATELHQMTGRAGRRGKDNIGFALIVPGRHQDPQLIHELKDSPPEPVRSQIRINFSMTLNLLLSHRPSEVQDLLERSFATFQEKRLPSRYREYWDSLLRNLKLLLPNAECDHQDPYEILEYIRLRNELHKATNRRAKQNQSAEFINALKSYLVPGRLFLHQNHGRYLVLSISMDQGHLVCQAHNIKKIPRFRKGRLRGKRVDIRKIADVYDYLLDFSGADSIEKIQNLLQAIPQDLKMLPLDRKEAEKESEELTGIEERLLTIPCRDCGHFKICHGKEKSELRKWLRDFQSLTSQLEHMPGGLWLSFKKHLRFLRETGFVDEGNRLTPDGIWASQLRLDHPLLIAEAIRRGGLQDLATEFIAGGIAPFVWDRAQDVDFASSWAEDYQEMIRVFKKILAKMEEIRRMMEIKGFENPQIFFWPSIALYAWAKGMPWKELLLLIPVDEGDLASMIIRTADHLRQVANLKATHPELAGRAHQAIQLILREPVLVD